MTDFARAFQAATDNDARLLACIDQLKQFEAGIASDPQANSVKQLAHDLMGLRHSGHATDDDITGLIRALGEAAFAARAKAARTFHGLDDSERQRGAWRALLEALAGEGFAAFKAKVEAIHTGIVFTAHPTFALPGEVRARLASAIDPAFDGDDISVCHIRQAPDDAIDLMGEHKAILSALDAARKARGSLIDDVLTIAQAHFPDGWRSLRPRILTLATWVGYDLDGRSDIHWGRSLAFRLEEKAQALAGYKDRLQAICEKDRLSEALIDRLSGAATLAEQQAALFAGDLDDPLVVVGAANMLTAENPDRLTSLDDSQARLSDLIDASDDDQARALMGLASDMRCHGLGVGLIHLRVNAAQVRGAVRFDLGVDEGVADFGRVALARAAERAQSTEQKAINFATVFTEKMTARRQFMLMAQILKHIDADSPIRFLIAECERPATVMGAVYMARLYGVADQVDISPLFETPEALERAGRFMEQLLDEPAYLDYARARGRVAIQIGYSDSGRFMGQLAAQMAAERAQIQLARALKARGLTDIDALVFNTHGESMGRGAHPLSQEDRIDHLMTPWAKSRFEEAGITLTNEMSFQGGDGVLRFGTPAIADATVGAIMLHGLSKAEGDADDPFYADINFTWDVYRALKAWQEDLFANPDYGVALTAFVPQMLVPTGSRKSRRSADAAAALRTLRAIPNNASLQQMAIPVNVSGGLGSSVATEADQLVRLFQKSKRAQALLRMAWRARALTSMPAFRAYADLYDAGFWVARAAREPDEARMEANLAVAARLKEGDVSAALSRLGHHLSADLIHFDRLFERGTGNAGLRQERYEARRALHILHALRLALAKEVFMQVAQLPDFSKRHDVTKDDLLDLVLAFRIDEAVALMDRVFPEAHEAASALSAITEPADADDMALHGYPEIQQSIIRPVARVKLLLDEIAVVISHIYGAWG